MTTTDNIPKEKKKRGPRRLNRKEHRYCQYRASGLTQKAAAEKVGGTKGIAAEERGYRLEKRPEIRQTIEDLKERFAPTVFENCVIAGLEALKIAKPHEIPKLIEAMGKITKGMVEPERKETVSTKRLPAIPAHITIENIEPALLETPKTDSEGAGVPSTDEDPV